MVWTVTFSVPCMYLSGTRGTLQSNLKQCGYVLRFKRFVLNQTRLGTYTVPIPTRHYYGVLTRAETLARIFELYNNRGSLGLLCKAGEIAVVSYVCRCRRSWVHSWHGDHAQRSLLSSNMSWLCLDTQPLADDTFLDYLVDGNAKERGACHVIAPKWWSNRSLIIRMVQLLYGSKLQIYQLYCPPSSLLYVTAIVASLGCRYFNNLLLSESNLGSQKHNRLGELRVN
ncbi:hypothetical protein F5Y14DRAFT_401191 [Nemania sp. NC0429]|nr:hypothetical protein F5Y14DRAFT_401191 [Nemania sp. NC0429]